MCVAARVKSVQNFSPIKYRMEDPKKFIFQLQHLLYHFLLLIEFSGSARSSRALPVDQVFLRFMSALLTDKLFQHHRRFTWWCITASYAAEWNAMPPHSFRNLDTHSAQCTELSHSFVQPNLNNGPHPDSILYAYCILWGLCKMCACWMNERKFNCKQSTSVHSTHTPTGNLENYIYERRFNKNANHLASVILFRSLLFSLVLSLRLTFSSCPQTS